jgi:hypothetical protein
MDSIVNEVSMDGCSPSTKRGRSEEFDIKACLMLRWNGGFIGGGNSGPRTRVRAVTGTSSLYSGSRYSLDP